MGLKSPKSYRVCLFIVLIFSVFEFKVAHAGLARFFTLDGKLTALDGVTPLQDTNLQLKLQILNPAQDCILYEEVQTGLNTVGTSSKASGSFNVQVGSEVISSKRAAGDSGNLMTQVYSNLAPINGKALSNSANCTFNPTSGDDRYLRVVVTPSSDGQDRILTPNMAISSVPGAVVADSAESLQGMGANQFLNLATPSAPNLTQANAETIFSNTNYPRLTSLLSVPASNFVQNSATNGALGIVQVAGQPASGLTAGQMWYDSVGNTLKYYDGTAVKTLASGSSGVTSVTAASTAGNPIVLGGTITAPTIDLPKATSLINGYLSSADWATFNSKQAAGNYLTALTGDVTAAGPGSAAATIAGNAITTTKINNLAVTDAKINDVGVNKITSSAGNYFTYKPNNTACTNGQILSWDNTNSRWACANDATSSGTVTAVSSTNADIAVATGTSTPTLTINTGTTANQIVKLDGTARLPAVDGSQLTNLPSAPVQSVAGRTGTVTLSNTDISGLGNAATKSVGTTAGTVAAGDDTRIVNSLQSGTIFVGDVSGAYNATSVDKIKGKAVSAQPTLAGQMLRYDGTNYTPGFVAMTDLRSNVTGSSSFASTCGAGQTLSYNSVGDIMTCTNIAIANTQVSGLGTAAILNVGTAANNLIQLDATPKLPAVDGSALTNLNASNVASGTLAATNGGTGQATYAVGDLLYASSTTALSRLPAGSTGQVLTLNSSAIPIWTGLPGSAPPTSSSSILKGNGSGGFSSAVAGTDFVAPATTVNGHALSANVTVTASDVGLGNVTNTTQAPAASKFIVQGTADAALTNAQFLGALPTGLVKNTTTTGALSIAVSGTDYLSPSWTGSTNLTTLGTIGTGTWQGSAIGAPYGGTGQVTYAVGDLLYASSTSALVRLPAGSNGQVLSLASGLPSWTAASTGTVTNISTGAGLTGGPITATGTIALANIANNNLLANTSGSAGAPAATTLSTLIDNAIGNTQGNILYRNATGWTILAPGTSGQQLQTQGAAANPIWATPNAGTVTSVSGTAPISVATGTTTPAISIAQANTSTSGYLSSTDWNTFNNKLGTSLAAANILVGNSGGTAAAVAPSGDVTMTTAGSFTVTKVQGKAISATAPTSAGQVLRYDGTSTYVPNFLSLADIRSTVTATNTMFPATACTAAQTLTWSSLTDTMSCTNIGISGAAVSSGQVAIANGGTGAATANAGFNALAPTQTGNSGRFLTTDGTNTAWQTLSGTTQWTTVVNDINFTTGNVGIGTASPGAKLEVSGASGTTLKIVDGNQASGKVLTSDAAGQASWQAAASSGGGIVTNTDITTTPYTVTSGQAGVYLTYNGASAGVINLPSLASLTNGWQVTIAREVALALTLTPNGADAFPGGDTTLEMQGQNLSSVTLTKLGSKWVLTNKTEDCIVGHSCWTTNATGGMKSLFAGTYNSHQYFTTPGGCATNVATPTCAGGTDTLTLTWAAAVPEATTAIQGAAANNIDGQAQSATLATYATADAAKYCENLVYAGYSDWYLPARQELNLLYQNSPVIGGFNYVTGTPYYWSSTEFSTTYAGYFHFFNGYINYALKTTALFVRCVRRF